jgi:D-apiose dehydrogenase
VDAAPLRVGLIGCGFFAENHLAAWSSMDDVKLAAVCDIDPEKARSAAKRYKAGASYGDAAEMLARERAPPAFPSWCMRTHAF